jgi:hypothetical protein
LTTTTARWKYRSSRNFPLATDSCRFRAALKLGVTVLLDEVAGDEFYTVMPIEEERDRPEREQMPSSCH